MYYTDSDIETELLDNWEQINPNDPKETLWEWADGASPVYNNDILKDWAEMPSEYNDSWASNGNDEMPDGGIFYLMAYDLHQYYCDKYVEIYDEILAKKESELENA